MVLTGKPGGSVTSTYNGSSSSTVVQGGGRLNGMTLDCPKLIRFHDLTQD